MDSIASLSRRTALANGAVFAASALVRPGPALADTGRASAKNMHVSLAAYSMREALTGGKMDLFKFIDWCAEMNLAGAELTSYYFKENFDTAYLHDLRRHAFSRGVTVSGTAIRNNFCLPKGQEKQKEIDQVKRWIDCAAELFAPHIRIFAGEVPAGMEKETAIGYAADGIRAVLGHAEERGIVLGLENHGGITARVKDHLAICDAVGENRWFGVNLDTGNYYTDAYEELAAAAPRAVNVQIKVEVFENSGPKVPADLERFKQILVDARYRGWIALEYEASGDPWLEIPMYIGKLKDLFEG
jgi:sugar phosphate isomerase/epimerase